MLNLVRKIGRKAAPWIRVSRKRGAWGSSDEEKPTKWGAAIKCKETLHAVSCVGKMGMQ